MKASCEFASYPLGSDCPGDCSQVPDRWLQTRVIKCCTEINEFEQLLLDTHPIIMSDFRRQHHHVCNVPGSVRFLKGEPFRPSIIGPIMSSESPQASFSSSNLDLDMTAATCWYIKTFPNNGIDSYEDCQPTASLSYVYNAACRI